MGKSQSLRLSGYASIAICSYCLDQRWGGAMHPSWTREDRYGQVSDYSLGMGPSGQRPANWWTAVKAFIASVIRGGRCDRCWWPRSRLWADLRAMAGGARGCDRPQEDLPQRPVQRHHAGRALFPRRQRLHADLRADEERQPRARLALPAGRLYRLRGRRRDRLVAAGLRRRLRRGRRPSASLLQIAGLPAHGRARTCARRW